MLNLYGENINSRLLMGSSGFTSPEQLLQAVRSANSQIVTLSLKREVPDKNAGTALHQELMKNVPFLLPNTAGCRTAKEAIQTAVLARELFATAWIKLEITCDDLSLHPHSVALLQAAKELTQQGFRVFPYCTADLSVCEALINAGCEVIMPWASPIGSGQGIQNVAELFRLIQHFRDTKIIIDAGIGAPSDACFAMEIGADAVLVNSAISRSEEPVSMAMAMSRAVSAGRLAYESGLMPQSNMAVATTLVVDRPVWHSDLLSG